jgi:hypothetical protein
MKKKISNLVPAFILIGLGLGAIANQIWDFNFWELAFNWWPAVVIVILGVRVIESSVFIIDAVIALLVLAFIQVGLLGYLPSQWGNFVLPGVLLVIGIRILIRNLFPELFNKEDTSDAPDYFVMFSGLEKKLTNKKFQGLNMTILFGGIDLDLSKVKLDGEEAVIDVFCMFGGFELKTPKGVRVDFQGVPVFGGVETKNTPDKGDKKIIIRGFTLFGGGEAKVA